MSPPLLHRMGCKGLWPHTGLGHFGGGQDWAFPSISFAPNFVECLWIGPLVSDFNCSTCVLGYQTTSTSNTTCIMPDFRPYRGWASSSDHTKLQIQDARGTAFDQANETSTPILLTGHTYTISAPLLEPKERRFVGYRQPYSRIRYELDFSRGAEVDIGCGTAVVGDGTGDANIPKDVFAHPHSMKRFSYQWPTGRGNLNADPPDPGHYPLACPRYHRFTITKPGNFTFVRTFVPSHLFVL